MTKQLTRSTASNRAVVEITAEREAYKGETTCRYELTLEDIEIVHLAAGGVIVIPVVTFVGIGNAIEDDFSYGWGEGGWFQLELSSGKSVEEYQPKYPKDFLYRRPSRRLKITAPLYSNDPILSKPFKAVTKYDFRLKIDGETLALPRP